MEKQQPSSGLQYRKTHGNDRKRHLVAISKPRETRLPY
jgi:hypothetical protein